MPASTLYAAPSTAHAPGNLDVIRALELCLAEARKGRVGFVVCALAESATLYRGVHAGTLLLQEPVLAALDGVVGNMAREQANRIPPDRDETLGAHHVCYNVAAGPLSYDFISWLIDAEMTRIREGAPAPLKVGFFLGRDGQTGAEDPARRQMLDQVARPALALVGAIEDDRAIRGRHKGLWTPRDVVAAARLGEKVPKLSAPHIAKAEMLTWLLNRVKCASPVTITLREAPHWPHRNSNLRAWRRFARHLQHRGERVVFVRDTAKAIEPLEGFVTCPHAAVDLHARMALYEHAKANLFVSNGPAGLAMYAARPCLMFLAIMPDGHVYPADTPSAWRANYAMEVGTQFPWSQPDQRIVWAPDSYDNIVAAWEKLMLAQPEKELAAG